MTKKKTTKKKTTKKKTKPAVRKTTKEINPDDLTQRILLKRGLTTTDKATNIIRVDFNNNQDNEDAVHHDDVQVLGDLNFATPLGMLQYVFGIDTKGCWRIGRMDADGKVMNLNQDGISIDSSLHLPTTFLAIMMDEIAFDLELTFDEEGEEE
jgi:hypothetical protein